MKDFKEFLKIQNKESLFINFMESFESAYGDEPYLKESERFLNNYELFMRVLKPETFSLFNSKKQLHFNNLIDII